VLCLQEVTECNSKEGLMQMHALQSFNDLDTTLIALSIIFPFLPVSSSSMQMPANDEL
jgi:hypothetical protein